MPRAAWTPPSSFHAALAALANGATVVARLERDGVVVRPMGPLRLAVQRSRRPEHTILTPMDVDWAEGMLHEVGLDGALAVEDYVMVIAAIPTAAGDVRPPMVAS